MLQCSIVFHFLVPEKKKEDFYEIENVNTYTYILKIIFFICKIWLVLIKFSSNLLRSPELLSI